MVGPGWCVWVEAEMYTTHLAGGEMGRAGVVNGGTGKAISGQLSWSNPSRAGPDSLRTQGPPDRVGTDT